MQRRKLSSTGVVASALVGVGLFMGVGEASATVYLDDDFSDNNRDGWILVTQSIENNTLDAVGGSMGMTRAERNSSAAIAYLTDAGSPITLAVGETMTLSFDVAFGTTTGVNNAAAFRWALMDSGGSRVTADSGASGAALSSADFNGWTGYKGQSAVFPTTPSGSTLQTRERSGGNDSLFTSPSWDTLAQTTAPTLTLGESNFYSASLSLTRTANGVDVQASFGDKTTGFVSDNTTPRITFDTVVLFAVDSLPGDVLFDNVKVEVIPEPSGLVVLSLAAMGLMARRRGSNDPR